MPQSAPRRCARCRQLCRGKCPRCDSWSGKGKTRSWSASGSARTSDARWLVLRGWQLREDPWCEICGAIASQVDHLDGTDYLDHSGHGRSWLSPDTVRSLCAPCHARRTAEQGRKSQGMKG